MNTNQTGFQNNTSKGVGTTGLSGTTGVTSGLTSNVTTGNVGVGTGGVGMAGTNVGQIRQQLQTLQGQLRQQTTGTNAETYVNAANKLQDVYDILNKLS